MGCSRRGLVSRLCGDMACDASRPTRARARTLAAYAANMKGAWVGNAAKMLCKMAAGNGRSALFCCDGEDGYMEVAWHA